VYNTYTYCSLYIYYYAVYFPPPACIATRVVSRTRRPPLTRPNLLVRLYCTRITLYVCTRVLIIRYEVLRHCTRCIPHTIYRGVYMHAHCSCASALFLRLYWRRWRRNDYPVRSIIFETARVCAITKQLFQLLYTSK